MNLAHDLELRASEAPDRDGFFSDDDRAWTYAETDARAAAVAASLASLGIGKGDRVALYLQNGAELAFVLFGAWKLGAVPVTISGLYNARELRTSIDKTEPVLVVTDGHDLEALAGLEGLAVPVRVLGGGAAALEAFPEGVDAPWEPAVSADDDEVAILFTGGTTGMPKAVSVTFGGVRASLARLAQVSKGRPGPYAIAPPEASPNLVALPLFHSGGQHTLLFAFHVGRPAVLLSRFSVPTIAHLLERHRFSNMFLLPTMLYDIVHADEPPDMSSVRSVLIAGQALSIHLRRQFEERFHIPIVMNYGSTEIGHVAGWTTKDMAAGLWKPGSAGRIDEGVFVEIRDDDDNALPVGEAGEVCVQFTMAKGYVDDPEATSELVRDGWVHSGDIGYVDEDGVLFLVGRKRDMIKCGGFQVWPEEIEEEIRAHPLVRDVRVVGVPHDRLGEIPRAVVVREPGDEPSDDDLAAALVELCRERLAHFKAPREVVFVDDLPRSAAGKIQRHAPSPETGGSQ
jgi:long-chain acyl-CoA synthetase